MKRLDDQFVDPDEVAAAELMAYYRQRLADGNRRRAVAEAEDDEELAGGLMTMARRDAGRKYRVWLRMTAMEKAEGQLEEPLEDPAG